MSKVNKRVMNLKYNKRACILVAVAVIICVSSLIVLALKSDKYVYINELQRPQDNEGARKYDIELVLDESVDNVTVYVEAKKKTQSELDEIFAAAQESLHTAFLGENTQLDCIAQPLNLISALPEYNMQVEWFIENQDVIDYWGDIWQSNEEKSTTVTAMLTYEGRVMDGVNNIREYIYELNIVPYSEAQISEMAMDRLFSDADKESADRDRIVLPDNYEGRSIKYRIKAENSLYRLLLIIPVIAAVFIVKLRSIKVEKSKKLKEQMMMEYPEIISKLALLTAAGMTPYNAITRIAADGRGEAYRRLFAVVGNIQSGASERSQYAAFGQIFGIYCYSRLGSMLEQNVVRGNEKLRAMLKEECLQALEDRKARARKAGEQAGTKMLFPMMLMLIVVMAVIMVPAFSSM